jgi:hypothetical protein
MHLGIFLNAGPYRLVETLTDRSRLHPASSRPGQPL